MPHAAPMATSFAAGDWYQDAPAYYDLIFDQGTAQETAFIEHCVARYGQATGRRLLEPACGTGRLLLALSGRGWQVDGYDASAPMLAIARERLGALRPMRAARLVEERLETFACASRYAAAYNLVSTFKYLLNDRDAVAHLRHTAHALLPGGIYVLGLHLSDYADRRLSRERWHAQEKKTHVLCNIQSWPADAKRRTEEVRSRLTVRNGRQTRRLETYWTFRTYDTAQLKRLLRQVPALELVATHDFCHDIERTRPLDDEQLDLVLVLRRRT